MAFRAFTQSLRPASKRGGSPWQRVSATVNCLINFIRIVQMWRVAALTMRYVTLVRLGVCSLLLCVFLVPFSMSLLLSFTRNDTICSYLNAVPSSDSFQRIRTCMCGRFEGPTPICLTAASEPGQHRKWNVKRNFLIKYTYFYCVRNIIPPKVTHSHCEWRRIRMPIVPRTIVHLCRRRAVVVVSFNCSNVCMRALLPDPPRCVNGWRRIAAHWKGNWWFQ